MKQYKDQSTQLLEDLNIDPYSPVTRNVLITLNNALRENDESHLWPINGKFNVTERAIRRQSKIFNEYGYGRENAYSYLYAVECTISYIVNVEN